MRKLDQQNNPSAKKTLTKQEKWLLIIEKAAAASPPSLQRYMDTLNSLENIPTQEKKFRNFAANSLRLRKSDEKIVSQIWELLMKERQKETEAADKQKEEVAAAKEKKDKALADSAQISDAENSKEGTKNKSSTVTLDSSVKKAMKKALKKASKKTLKFKSLRKEVKAKLELHKMTDDNIKAMMQQIVDENPKKMKLDGKSIMLID